MSGTFSEVKPAAVAADGFATVEGRLRSPLQFTIVPGDTPTGTGAVTVIPAAPAGVTVGFEPVLDSAGDPLVVAVDEQGTFQLPGDGWFSALRVAGADFTLLVATEG